MIRPILIHPDPRLRKVARPVERIDASVLSLADDMLDTMYDAPGVGLAAPQVAVDARVVVMDCSAKDTPPEPIVLINPEVVWTSEARAVGEEGCLSIPEIYEDVERAEAVRLRWQDRDGAPQEAEFTGLWSVCAQHEIEHLDGKLFIDKLGAVKRAMITQKMKKRKRQG